MPGIGIGISTPFSQPSNYQTVLNHRFRDETPYDPSKQLKIKCPYCGVWARKGRDCTLCGTKVPGASSLHRQERPRSRSPGASRRDHTRIDIQSKADASASATTPGRVARPTTPRNTSTWDASIPSMSPGASYYSANRESSPTRRPYTRDETPLRHGPDQQVRKVKCSYCGIWVPVGKMCALCRTQA
ncbi:Hypothetical protein, putative [Bodo saltans]|uniref:Uncharacterized protein n=1 Tax=Bodo saltans TaxID=75058 RepID=A0A0S4JPN9_BODSA|nr:Hypothetical protein, putative [Bodo saltans]|eukprot:CUG91044.1 Hypothetical protein, putative [Bodo saltans]